MTKTLIPSVVRVLFGALFLMFGANKLVPFMPMPELPAVAGPFVGGLASTGYFFPLIKKGRGLEMLKQDPGMPDSAVTLEYLADNTWLVGDPDEVVRRIRALREDVGNFGTLLVIGHEWEPREAWTRSMRLLVDEVLPRL